MLIEEELNFFWICFSNISFGRGKLYQNSNYIFQWFEMLWNFNNLGNSTSQTYVTVKKKENQNKKQQQQINMPCKNFLQ